MMRGTARVAGLSTLLLAAATAATVQEPEAQVPEFPTEIEVVALDVTVVDKGGRPVRGLGAQDFTVTVRGKPRRIVSVDFVAAAQEAAEAQPVGPLPPGLSSNAGAAPGRLVLIAVDQWLIVLKGTNDCRPVISTEKANSPFPICIGLLSLFFSALILCLVTSA